jgi:hypothetical protein
VKLILRRDKQRSLSVASKRKIVANRRNALASTGPRSGGGRNRASRNAYRHGLAAGRPLDGKLSEAVKRLARKIAGGSTNRLIVQSADLAARAHFDIARIRELETALIERKFAFVESGEVQVRGALDLDGLAEGVRRVLPQLVKLSRYARRAANMRDRALLTIRGSASEITNQG